LTIVLTPWILTTAVIDKVVVGPFERPASL
jgi:hypothetical protein